MATESWLRCPARRIATLGKMALLGWTLTLVLGASQRRAWATPTPTPTPIPTPVRGQAGDLWADIVLGQPDFSEVVPHKVSSRRLFHPGGVLVDRSVRPNRVYVFDGGNSRVLGFAYIGHVQSGAHAGAPCTSDSDYGARCVVDEARGADIVLGQPSFNRGACNGDGGFQSYPQRPRASAATFCSMREDQISLTEGGSFANLAVDTAGNLYVPDFFNHRVLRYDSPFTSDTTADDVWGQADFSGNECNRGRGVGAPDAQSLCFGSPFNEGFVGGVAVDPGGNLWVADNQNNRVLRFPFDPDTGKPAHAADLVLGQPDFFSWQRGSGLDRMWAPAGVRVGSSGTVYVADSQAGGNFNTARILVFEPPLSSGMAASRTLGSGFRLPTGLEFDVSGGLWVSDRINNQLLLYGSSGAIEKVLFKDLPNMSGTCGGNYVGNGPDFYSPGDNGWFPSYNVCDSAGSIGVDIDGNILVAASSFVQDVWRFPAPIPTPQPGVAHSADARLFKPFQFAAVNEPVLEEMYSARGVAVAAGQLIVADGSRLLFWNDPPNFTNGQPPDGFTGVPSAQHEHGTRPPFGRIRADDAGRLWATRGNKLLVYQLPLTQGEAPAYVIAPPIPVLGGGELRWESLNIGGIAPVGGGEQLWVADPGTHRVLRIRNPLTNPVVDVLLGQESLSGKRCNRGRGQSAPSQNSLCYPGAVALDANGNLWVSDHALEVAGNHRLLVFSAASIPNRPSRAVFGIPADQVLGTNGSFTGPPCQDALCGPFEPAFTWQGQMAVGLNSYIGSRFALLYTDPRNNATPTPLKDFESMPYAATFDHDGNLYIASLNRARVLIYRNPLSLPAAPTPTPTATPQPSCFDFAPDNVCVPGGGKAKTDCHLEWKLMPVPSLNRRGLPKNVLYCYEGDPRCDADPDLSNHSCSFQVALCINNSDARFVQCAPANIAAFEVRSPDPARALPPEDRANVATLEDQAGAGGFGVQILRRRTPLPTPGATPNASTNTCGTTFQLTVPLKQTALGTLSRGRKRFRVGAWTSAGILDSDSLRLVCRPSTCGDGAVQRHEECDDGNRTNGDGCDQACRTEEP